MPFAEGQGQSVQPYKYGSKEFDTMHGLNQCDFHARQYDPAIARFTSMDPLAEKYYSWSPYVYCGNNPLRFTDPTGMEWLTEKDEQTAAEMTRNLNNKRDNVDRNIDKQTAEKDKIKNDPKCHKKIRITKLLL